MGRRTLIGETIALFRIAPCGSLVEYHLTALNPGASAHAERGLNPSPCQKGIFFPNAFFLCYIVVLS